MISALLALPLLYAQSVEQPRWLVAGALSSGTPAALADGVTVGLAAEIQRTLDAGVFVSARAGWSAAEAANRSYVIEHDQLDLAFGAGFAAARGVGRVWAQAGLGALALREHLRDNVPLALPVRHFAVGPSVFGELGVALTLRGGWRVLLAAGPTLAYLEVNGAGRLRFGGTVRLGAQYGF